MTTTQYKLIAKRDLIGAYDITTYKKGDVFYPWHKGEGSPLFDKEFIIDALKKGYVRNNCGHGCTEEYEFPDSFEIVEVKTTTTQQPSAILDWLT